MHPVFKRMQFIALHVVQYITKFQKQSRNKGTGVLTGELGLSWKYFRRPLNRRVLSVLFNDHNVHPGSRAFSDGTTMRSRASSNVFERSPFAAMFLCIQWPQLRPSIFRENYCLLSKNQFDDCKPEWLAEKPRPWWLQQLKQICKQTLSSFSLLKKEIIKALQISNLRFKVLELVTWKPVSDYAGSIPQVNQNISSPDHILRGISLS